MVTRDAAGRICELLCTGHAGAGEEGQDLVCCAASVVMQTLIGALDELSERPFDYEIDAEIGRIRCSVTYGPEADVVTETLMAAAEIGLQQIANSYGAYLTLSSREV